MNVISIGQIAPTSASAGASGGPAAVAGSSAADEFRKWAQMSPGERMRANMLSSMGLDESKLAAMSEEEQAKVEAKIRELIEAKVRQDVEQGKTGVLTDHKV